MAEGGNLPVLETVLAVDGNVATSPPVWWRKTVQSLVTRGLIDIVAIWAPDIDSCQRASAALKIEGSTLLSGCPAKALLQSAHIGEFDLLLVDLNRSAHLAFLDDLFRSTCTPPTGVGAGSTGGRWGGFSFSSKSSNGIPNEENNKRREGTAGADGINNRSSKIAISRNKKKGQVNKLTASSNFGTTTGTTTITRRPLPHIISLNCLGTALSAAEFEKLFQQYQKAKVSQHTYNPLHPIPYWGIIDPVGSEAAVQSFKKIFDDIGDFISISLIGSGIPPFLPIDDGAVSSLMGEPTGRGGASAIPAAAQSKRGAVTAAATMGTAATTAAQTKENSLLSTSVLVAYTALLRVLFGDIASVCVAPSKKSVVAAWVKFVNYPDVACSINITSSIVSLPSRTPTATPLHHHHHANTAGKRLFSGSNALYRGDTATTHHSASHTETTEAAAAAASSVIMMIKAAGLAPEEPQILKLSVWGVKGRATLTWDAVKGYFTTQRYLKHYEHPGLMMPCGNLVSLGAYIEGIINHRRDPASSRTLAHISANAPLVDVMVADALHTTQGAMVSFRSQ